MIFIGSGNNINKPVRFLNLTPLKGNEMTATKIVNYTPEMVETIVEGYKAGKSVEALAEEVGRSTKSIVAKLGQLKLYKSPAKEAGKREMKKAEMVAKIAEAIGATEESLESLEKATGPALMAVLKALT